MSGPAEARVDAGGEGAGGAPPPMGPGGAPPRIDPSDGETVDADARLRAVARARFAASAEAPTAFFDAHTERIARSCQALARAFHGGHRLLVFGAGAQGSDALHVSVEFVHPVIVGKRALPALALPADAAGWLRALGEPGDVAFGIAAEPEPPPALRAALAAARDAGMLTFALLGGAATGAEADHVFAVPSGDPFVVQEVHETLYHVLWELVHVYLDHPELIG